MEHGKIGEIIILILFSLLIAADYWFLYVTCDEYYLGNLDTIVFGGYLSPMASSMVSELITGQQTRHLQEY